MSTTLSWGKRVQHLPDLGNEVVNVVPSKGAIGDTAEPTQLICGGDECMRMQVIRNRDTWVPERGCNKAYTVIRRTGMRWRCQCRGGVR